MLLTVRICILNCLRYLLDDSERFLKRLLCSEKDVMADYQDLRRKIFSAKVISITLCSKRFSEKSEKKTYWVTELIKTHVPYEGS